MLCACPYAQLVKRLSIFAFNSNCNDVEKLELFRNYVYVFNLSEINIYFLRFGMKKVFNDLWFARRRCLNISLVATALCQHWQQHPFIQEILSTLKEDIQNRIMAMQSRGMMS